MIEITETTPEGIMEIRATGRVTEQDYESVLIPAVEKALAGEDKVRLLYQVGPGFEGYSAGAMWADARLGMRHWSGFDRVAVVTDSEMLAGSVKLFGFAMPCPVKTFDLEEVDEARRWLRESLGAFHMEEIGEDALMIRLLGKLDSKVYEEKAADLDAWTAKAGRFRLLLDLREFDGWQGMSALGQHLSLVKSHHKQPARVAVVGDAAWMRMAEGLMSQFLEAKTKYFDEDDFEAGKAWLLA
ncbi:SpoIIAA family protein [Pseudooceanicola sp. 502str34]|uniref:STAS/SEC14 domain-containing protein n=1 Tax=Maritimibacter alkaliphilus TaxID=404236 RepID=UPI001C94A866|nr:STAS/SEC14 domain-containing protein [Maritimibacter alkaliphilus]MBY6092805.1 STAS/SEC14 domain-containing protein [Maritimibacter alkaliphilus]